MMNVEFKRTVGYLFPEKISLFKNKEEAFQYYPHSHQRLTFICPNCGKEKEMTVDKFSSRKFYCKFCDDKISIPNKMNRDISFQLKEMGIIEDFDLEYMVVESKLLYRYDSHFLYNGIEYFIEVHGSQHKDERSFKHSGDITIARDKEKEKYIENRNNSKLIIIWCDKDNFEYRKNNFINGFNKIGIDLNKIDWTRVEKSLTNNLLKNICEYYNNHNDVPIYKIAEEFKISTPYVITKYLKRGTKLGFCNYNRKKHIGKISTGTPHGQKVLVYNSNEELLYIFSIQAEAARKLSKIYNKKFIPNSISIAINRKQKYHGLIFRNFNDPLIKIN